MQTEFFLTIGVVGKKLLWAMDWFVFQGTDKTLNVFIGNCPFTHSRSMQLVGSVTADELSIGVVF